MAKRYTYETTLSWGGDEPTAELDVKVSYTVVWGAAERGPTYACGGTPADPDEIDEIRVEEIDGVADARRIAVLADGIIDKLWGSERDLAAMIAEAVETDVADRDAYEEARWEERRMEAR